MSRSQSPTAGENGESVLLGRDAEGFAAVHRATGTRATGETRAEALEALAAALREVPRDGREQLLSKLGIDPDANPEWAERL